MSIYKCYIFLKKYKCYIFISLSKILHHVFHCCATMHILLITPCMEVGTNQVSDAGGQFICYAGHLLSYVGKLKKKGARFTACTCSVFCRHVCASSARAPLAVNWASANAALIGVQRARARPSLTRPERSEALPDRAAPLGVRICPHARGGFCRRPGE